MFLAHSFQHTFLAYNFKHVSLRTYKCEQKQTLREGENTQYMHRTLSYA